MSIFQRFSRLSLWNKIGVIGSVASIISLAIFFFWDSGSRLPEVEASNRAGDDSTQIIHQGRGDVIINQSPSEHVEAVDISGRWNPEKAWMIVWGKLNSATTSNPRLFCETTLCEPRHSRAGEFSLIYRDRETVLLVTESIDPKLDCHACAPFISLFEFEKKSRGWKLVQTDFAAIQWGSWGSLEASNLRAKVIGHNIYGIFLENGYTMGGEVQIATSVFSKVADNYRKVLHIMTHLDDSGAIEKTTDWSAEIGVKQGSTGFFDLIVTAQRVLENKPLNEKIVFEFDGVQYFSPSVPDYLSL